MKSKRLVGAFSAAIAAMAATTLGGCQAGGSPYAPLVGAADRYPVQSHGPTGYQVLFSFDGEDGESPTTALTQLTPNDGALYGTTAKGGNANLGTVYRITARGSQRVLLSFKPGKNSLSPAGALTAYKGLLYGAAWPNPDCGRHTRCAGAIFSIDKRGTERVVYAFKGGRDGALPVGALTVLNGDLYGVTKYGGKYGLGTVFVVTPSGSERALHSFVKAYGLHPTGGLVAINGTLYGTTTAGGAYSLGTVFSISPAGKEIVLYSFTGSPDGASPSSGLTDVGGVFYGETSGGGLKSCGGTGFGTCGTVFAVDTSGHETVAYGFDGADGASPSGGLIDVDGTLYGTTLVGGGVHCTTLDQPYSPCGTVFSIDPSGDEKVLYAFRGQPDGAYPEGGLTYANQTLYGTTGGGGSNSCAYSWGCGTVFAIPLKKHRSNRR